MEFKRKKGAAHGCAWISSYRGELVKFNGQHGAWTAVMGEYVAHASTLKAAYERVVKAAAGAPAVEQAPEPAQAPKPAPAPKPTPEAIERRARLELRIEREAHSRDLRERRTVGGQIEALGQPLARAMHVVLPEGVVLAIMLMLLPLIAAVAGLRAGYHATRTRRKLAYAALAPKVAVARDAIGAGLVRGLYFGVAVLALAVAAVVVIASRAGEMVE